MMIQDKDISFVVQGPVHPVYTAETLRNIRHFYPDAELILATSVGNDVTGLDYDQVVITPDPGYTYYSFFVAPKTGPMVKNNVNRQIVSTLAGIQAARRSYIFKLRTDFILEGRLDTACFFKYDQPLAGFSVFQQKILACTYFTRDPRNSRHLFHISDLIFFGQKTDMLNLFDLPLMPVQEEKYHLSYRIYRCRYVPEQYIWINCLRKNGHTIDMDFQNDCSPLLQEQAEKYFVANFILLDWDQFHLRPPHRLTNVAQYHHDTCITHHEWEALYKKYADPRFMVDRHRKDAARIRLNKISRKIRLYRIWSNLCALQYIGPHKKAARHRIRQQIMTEAEENKCYL